MEFIKKHKNKIIICYVVLICISMLTLGKGVYLPIIGVVTSPIIEKIRGTIILSSFIILPLMLFVWLIKGAINDTIKKQQEYEQSEIDNDKISSLTERMLNNDFNFKEFDNILNKDKENHPINDYEKKHLLIKSWENTITKALEENCISEELEKNLLLFSKNYNLSQEDLDSNNKFEELTKSAILRKLSEGQLPKIKYEVVLPFNFQKDEEVVWIFQNVEYSEIKEKTRYEGGSLGGSFRVAKGIYFRTSSFRGHPVHYQSIEYIGTGILVITNKHIYFGCQYQNFRIKYEKIVSFTPYSDGIGIQRDAMTAKPQIFKVGDGWFIYNLLMNISKTNN